MSYGRRTPDGSLPVFSVETEQEARDLLILACPTNGLGQFVAEELVHEQTFVNLAAFSDRLEKAWKEMKRA